MPRQDQQTEQAVRAAIEAAIEREAMQTDKITYYPPSYVVSLLEEWGYSVTRATVTAYYGKHGIKNEKGLWVRKME